MELDLPDAAGGAGVVGHRVVVDGDGEAVWVAVVLPVARVAVGRQAGVQ